MSDLESTVRLAVAGLAGLAVGVEREWSGHASGPKARFAGVRTFLLLGTLGGIAGWLLDSGGATVAAALLAGAGGLIVAAYLTAVTVLALGEKAAIRDFVRRIGQEEIRAAFQFAVLALVILPLLPEGPIGPFGGVRPRALWAVVLLFSGLNFAGYITRRALGDAGGYQAMGALGGLLSSTAVTLSFSRRSRAEPANAIALAVGTVAACTVLVPRVLGLTLVLNPALLPAASLALAPVFLAGGVLIAVGRRHLAGGAPEGAPPPLQNPLQLGSAIRLAVAFQAVLTVLHFLGDRPGERSVLLSAGLAGLTDMDALTLGMNRLANDRGLISIAARALTLGVIVNTAVVRLDLIPAGFIRASFRAPHLGAGGR